MRLPSDATLLVPDPGAADEALLKAWGEEALPLYRSTRAAATRLPAPIWRHAWMRSARRRWCSRMGSRATRLGRASTRRRRAAIGCSSLEGEAGEFGGEARVVSVETAVEAARRAKVPPALGARAAR